MKNITIEEKTFKRLDEILKEMMKQQSKNIDHDELLNILIDNYLQNNWDIPMASGG